MARKVGKWNPSLHPRDARGRFTRSSTRVMKGSDTTRARSAVTGFRPAKIDTPAAVGEWLAKHAGAAPADDSAMGRYLAGGWRETNPAIRREKTPPPDVVEIDAAFSPLAEDVVLRRQVPLAMFAHIPVGDLVGMKVRDAAYASTSIDQPGQPSAADAVTMHIATPAGTPAFVNPDAGEVLLGRDTEVAITRAEPNGAGGWDLYGVVIPKKAIKREDRTEPGDDQPAAGDTPAATDGDTAGQPAGDTGDNAGDNAGQPAPEAPAGDASTPAGAPAQDGVRQAARSGDTATGDGTPGPAGGGRGRGRAERRPRAAARRPEPAQDDTAAPAGGGAQTGETPAAGPGLAGYEQRRERLAAGVASGVASRRRLSGGNVAEAVELVTFNNGDQAIRKATRENSTTALRPATEQQDAEELTAALAAALGAPTPAVHRAGPTEIYAEYVDGRTAMEYQAATSPAEAGALQTRMIDSDEGRMLGLLDMLTENYDRHGGNWMIDTGGRLVGIDHGQAFWHSPGGPKYPPANFRKPFTAHFMEWNDSGTARGWADNDISPADIAEARRRLDALRPEFERLGHGDWHDFAAGRLDTLGQRARGTRDRIAGRDPGQAATGETPAAGTRTPAERARPDLAAAAAEIAPPPPIVYAPTDGAMADIDPVDRERIRVAAEDNAGRIARTPFMRSSVSRYVAEGRDLRDMVDRYGLATVANAVRQVLDQRPELAERGTDDVELAKTYRRDAAQDATEAANTAIEAGDFAAARAALDEGERIDPTFTLPVPGGPPMDWPAMRELVDEVERERTGDGTPAAGTSAPDAGPAGSGTSQAAGTDVPGAQDTPATPPAGDAEPAGDAGPPEQLDIAGGTTAFDLSRAEVGMAERPQVGRTSVFGRDQQLGLFADESRELKGQEALLDALLAMPAGPAAAPPPDAPPAPLPPAPDAGDDQAAVELPTARESIVPADLSRWSDEQLAELFREVSAVDSVEQLDEDGLQRIADEWERREAAMAELVASVPADLTAMPDEDLERLFARVTGELGTEDEPTVQRMIAELDRRTEVERQARENAPKLAMLARPVDSLTDDEIEVAFGYASDLGDEDALVRVSVEWERREREQQAREAAAQAERDAREAAQRAEAIRQAEIATARAAAEHAEAQRIRQFDAFGAAAAAAIVPRLGEADVNTAVGLLGETGMRRLMGDQWVDEQFGDRPDLSEIARNGLMMTGARQLPPGDQVRILFAAADLEADREFDGWTDSELFAVIRDGMFIQGADRERARRAGREQTRRKVRTLRAERAEQFRQARLRAAAAPPGELTNAELELAPVLVTVDNPDAEDVVARLGALRGEVERRQAELARIAAEKAAGPAGPARYANPMQRYGGLLMIATRPSNDTQRQARDRLRRAQAAVYGLPEDAAEKDIKAAARKDPRPHIDQVTEVLAWYRHLGAHEDIGETQNIGGEPRVGGWPVEYLTGWPDDADVPDTPDPLPPAYVSKADEVWEAIRDNARDEVEQGRYDTAGRSLRAIARTYRIPVPPIGAGGEGLGRLQHQVHLALRNDNRHPKDRAADFLAQFRALAAEDGVDPADTLRYGPPDKGRRKPAPASFRQSTPDQQRRIDELVARGWDWLEAYAEVHGADPEALRRSEAGSEKEIKQAYVEFVERQFRDAETATAGNLLTKSAAARGVDARSLFSGPWSTAKARASEELLRWWADNPRMTYADFKAMIVGGADARAARERMITAGKGNEFA